MGRRALLFALLPWGVILFPITVSAQNIHLVTLEGNYRAVVRALDQGESPDSYNRTGFAPIHSASRQGRTDIVRLLLDRGGTVDIRSQTRVDGGQAALHVAARNGHGALVAFLLSRDADPNIQDNRGNTPLHDAAISGDPAITRSLIRAGASVVTRNNQGQTVLEVASNDDVATELSSRLAQNQTEVNPELALFITGAALTVLPLAVGLPVLVAATGLAVDERIGAIYGIQILFAVGASALFGLPFLFDIPFLPLADEGYEIALALAIPAAVGLAAGIAFSYADLRFGDVIFAPSTSSIALMFTVATVGLGTWIAGTVLMLGGSERLTANGVILNSDPYTRVTVAFGGSQLVVSY